MNLGELAARERTVVDTKVAPATGLMEHKWQQLAEAGTFEDYRAIHRGYVGLIDDEGSGTEALKPEASVSS